MWTLGNISARRDLGKFGIQVMPHSGLMPSMPALQQAMREPLARARSISKPDYSTTHTFADHKNSLDRYRRSPETRQKPMTGS